MPDDLATIARNTLLQIVTAARGGQPADMRLAASITDDYARDNGGIYPLFISAVSFIETIIQTVANELDMPPDRLFSGICLGLTISQIEAGEENQ